MTPPPTSEVGKPTVGTFADPRQLGIDEFSDYSLIIDARTPREYEEDHIPGAINLPVVDNVEFAEVGTKYVIDPHRMVA